jgi:hypothetical protein
MVKTIPFRKRKRSVVARDGVRNRIWQSLYWDNEKYPSKKNENTSIAWSKAEWGRLQTRRLATFSGRWDGPTCLRATSKGATLKKLESEKYPLINIKE